MDATTNGSSLKLLMLISVAEININNFKLEPFVVASI
jgi:hypothetical protein